MRAMLPNVMKLKKHWGEIGGFCMSYYSTLSAPFTFCYIITSIKATEKFLLFRILLVCLRA